MSSYLLNVENHSKDLYRSVNEFMGALKLNDGEEKCGKKRRRSDVSGIKCESNRL